MSLEEIRSIRLAKLAKLEQAFGTAFPSSFKKTHALRELHDEFRELEKKGVTTHVAGRVRAVRGHGGATFIDIEEGAVIFQLFLKRDIVGVELYDLFIACIDVGDFIYATGTLFRTKKKEETLEIKSWLPLAKSLRPLPEKWHGIQDAEERFRKRALDLLMNPETRERFRLRSRVLASAREFLMNAQFEEVETPILQPLYGGALARPFTTHHNALDTDFYLRIAPELYLKRLMVGGMTRVFEIGKNFRNEGIDVTHSPEFTELEGYMAYSGREELMKLLEQLLAFITKKSVGKASFKYGENLISIKAPFKRITFYDAIRRYAMISSVETVSEEDLRIETKRLGIIVGRADSRGKLLDEIFKKVVRKNFIQPMFVTNHPLDISPLAKAADDGTADRIQLIVGGQEVMNAYVELNNPLEQRQRFLAQEELRRLGEAETSRLDEDYLEHMEYGMPPTVGFGIGMDRLMQIFSDTHNVRDVILFPLLKPK